MFNIEIDKVLLEIGAGKSEHSNLDSYSPDTCNIIVIANKEDEKAIATIVDEVIKKYYPKYNFEILLNNFIPKENVRITLIPKTITNDLIYKPFIPETLIQMDEQHLKTVGNILGAKK